MKLTDLLEEFNVVIDTAEGLTELRSLILGLAVRGKLVAQDPNDEPASELLKMIGDEKERLYEEGKIRKPRSLKSQAEEELPFELPNSWLWCKIGDIAKIQGGGTPKTSENKNWADNGIPWVTPADLNDLDSKFISKGRRDISETGLTSSSTFLLPEGSVLFSSRAPIGYVAIAENDICTNQGFQSSIPYMPDTNNFIYYYLKYVGEILDERASGTTFKEVSGTFVANVEFPLPPLSEQHRIVQKIESLFAEVDELEEKLNRQTKLDEKLQLAVNAEVQKAPDTEASKYAWNFITSNFDTLYHTPEAIDNLKKNILNEAVRGRLVPQNPNDEPASELLKKIEAEKQRLYDEGEIRKPKKLPPVKDDEVPFEIPESWEWCRLGDSSFNLDAKRVPLSRADRENRQGDYPYYGASGIIDHIDDYIFEDDLLLIGEDGANLINRSTPIAFIATGKYWVNNHAHVLDAIDFKLLKWLEAYVNSINLEPYVTGTAQPKLNQTRLNKILVALPPLEEQHRIVQRIEELFAICDRFKAQLEKRQAVNEKLVKGLVKEVLEGSTNSIEELKIR